MVELLTDPARCQVMLVTLPEETPVNELVDTAYTLEDRVGVSARAHRRERLRTRRLPRRRRRRRRRAADAVAVGLRSTTARPRALADAAAFRRRASRDVQADQVERLAELLPLPQIRLPFLFTPTSGRPRSSVLADELDAVAGIDPPRRRRCAQMTTRIADLVDAASTS